MENNTCPYCGSEEDPILSGRYFRKYKCDSTQWIDRYTGETRLHQSEDCMRIELANLRSHNRDLQQAYDHVLECEQNRCREVVELQEKLATVTTERDEERENSRILLASRDEETAIADSWMRKCNELEQQLDGLRRRIDEAPVVWITTESLEDDNVAFVFPTAYGDGFTRVRLVRDDQPGETDA